MCGSLVQGQEDRKYGVAGVALAFDQALMLADDVLGDGQAQAGAVRAAADHGVEDGFLQLRRNTRAVVRNVNRYVFVLLRMDADSAFFFSFLSCSAFNLIEAITKAFS